MTPEQEKMWEVLQTEADELRRQFIESEFLRLIEDKIAKSVSKDIDRLVYSSMVKSYYESEKSDIYDGPRILDYIKNST
jgi:hypothetical protein